MEFVSALITEQQRFQFIEFQLRALHKWVALLDDVEAESNMIDAVAGECVEANFQPLHALRLLRSGLFFHRVNDGLNQMNFVHKLWPILPRKPESVSL